ncbi:ABC transporter permease [Actinoalloteichus spitiensis]|uniref:ABC transporter permease n=1 Tax=Actinoalloteichus spitiensis TaxID=252394 RepID=UPI000374E96A|nr:ABC transporter permease [Actinoalloteichus spitiensis]
MTTNDVPSTRTAPAATGRPGSLFAEVGRVLEGHWVWYRLNWRATVISSVLMPALYLIAMGIGMGSLVEPGEFTQGHDYLVYLAPAVLVVSMVQTAAGESTYPVLSGFKWQRNYLAVAATPISPRRLALGELTWIGLRLLFSGLAYLLIAALLGALLNPMVLLSLLAAVLTGMAFAAPVVAYSAATKGEGTGFNALFRFVVMPMVLFAGTFYPVSQLPELVQPVAWITPLWHGTELARGLAFGTLEALPALLHLSYLLALAGIGTVLACRHFHKRLVV